MDRMSQVRPTMYGGNIYPFAFNATSQAAVNPPATQTPSAVTPGGKAAFNMPALSMLSAKSGLSVPTLFVMGFVAWFLFHQYD